MPHNTFPALEINDLPIVKEEVIITDDGYNLSVHNNINVGSDFLIDRHQFKNTIKSETVLDNKMNTADDTTANRIDGDSTKKRKIDGNESSDESGKIQTNLSSKSIDVKKWMVPNCSNCKKEYKFEDGFKTKVCWDCRIDLQYECTQCHKQFNNLTFNARRHLKNVCLASVNSYIFSCDKCKYKSSRKDHLNRHIKHVHKHCNQKKKNELLKHGNKINDCNLRNSIRKAKTSKIDVKKRIVPNCSKCKKKYKFEHAFVPKVCWECRINLQYKCTQCHKQFNNLCNTERHLKEVCLLYFNPAIFCCDYCNYKSSRKSTLKDHLKCIHNRCNQKEENERLNYDVFNECQMYCTKCDTIQDITSVNKKTKMCNTCETKMLYFCNKCDRKIWKTYNGYTGHLRKCNSFQCLKCDFKTHYQVSFDSHMRTIHSTIIVGKNSCFCSKCGKTYLNKACLIKHKKQCKTSCAEYVKSKQFQCILCNYKTLHLMKIKKHISNEHN